MKKLLIISVLCLVLVAGLFVGCNNQNKQNDGEIDGNNDIQIGKLNFEPINEEALVDDNLKSWFESNYKYEGISTIKHDDDVYVLLGAGEQRTGGYSVEITSVEGKEHEIVVSGKLNSPKTGEMVIQAITYPNAIVRIHNDERSIVLGNFEKPTKQNLGNDNLPLEVIEGTGIYVGQADSNVIEIIVDGKPQGYTLSEKIRDYFNINSNSYKGLNKDDVVHFTYQENISTGQMIIYDIYKIEGINDDGNSLLGKYIGQIDGNSIELKVNGEIGAYRLSEEAKSILQNGTIKRGDSIYFEYEENEYDEMVITNMKKITQN